MTQIAVLHEQAAVLRALADSFSAADIRGAHLDIAERCESMAKAMEENPQGAGLKPAGFPPDLH